MFCFLHLLFNKCVLERLQHSSQEKRNRSNRLVYHSLSNWFLGLHFMFYVVLCKEFMRNSEVFHRILEIKKNRVEP